MIVSIEGQEATAKSTMALTAPLPIVCFAFDIVQRRAIQGTAWDTYFKDLKIETIKYDRDYKGEPKPNWSGNDITIYELPSPIQLDSNRVTGYIRVWEYFMYLLADAYNDNDISTVVVDTMTIARRVKADAHLEGLNIGKAPGDYRKQLIQIEYGPINGAIENIYSLFAQSTKNLITTHHLMDEYKPQLISGQMQDAPTGNYLLEGWNKTYRAVDVALRNTKVKGQITSTFVKCGDNLSLEGGPCIPADWNGMAQLIMGSLGGRIEIPLRNLTPERTK